MKIFRFFANNNNGETALYKDVSTALMPDSALLIQKRPFFIPDFTQQCMVQLCACIRINRLGRSIHPQFAHRYYKDLTLAVHFVARDLLAQLQAQLKPWDKALGFDNAVAVAETTIPTPSTMVDTETEAEDAETAINLSLHIADTQVNTVLNVQKVKAVADQLIADVSQFYTMRQGDLLLIPLQVAEQQVHIDDHLSICCEEQEVLAFNIK